MLGIPELPVTSDPGDRIFSFDIQCHLQSYAPTHPETNYIFLNKVHMIMPVFQAPCFFACVIMAILFYLHVLLFDRKLHAEFPFTFASM